MVNELSPGMVVWVDLGVGVGREQAGRRPCVIVSTREHLRAAIDLATVVPCTTRDRAWGNHIGLVGPSGLPDRTFAMTEQTRTISRERIHASSGMIESQCLARIRWWIENWTINAA